ncbi:MAG: class I SAM-dependent methyltransferase [Candidatus Eisenbacteria bacterium]|nr:class I SAM-dependent methyltransferase [Candidatus Eisenbacteria bacterium]
MSDASMIRTLDAQARAIWPQESELVRRYGFSPDIRILDAGCGTGECSARLAEMFPRAEIMAVDILDHHLALARERHGRFAPRLRFEHQSIFELPAADASYDLTVCRHVIHSVPHAERVLRELARVTRPGGRLHLIPEDYGMLHFPTGGAHDVRAFWHEATTGFGEATSTDLFVGRNSYGHLADLGLEDITVDYVIVDSLRVPRETFAAILEAWRDGYVESIAERSRFSGAEVTGTFDQMIASIRDPRRYSVWMVPVVAARIPARR